MTDQQMKAISVEDLLRSGNISRRTYNTLVKARLRTLFDLRKYQNGLKRLFSPQSPNLTEVTQLVEKAGRADYLPNISGRLFMDTVVEKTRGEQLLDDLNDEELQLLQLSYDNVLRRLLASRQRVHTVIANALAQVSLPIFLRDFLYDDDDKIMILYNVGRTSVDHFVEVKKAMKSVLDIIQQQPEMVRYHLFLQRCRGRFDDDDFILDFYKEHQRLPLLYILQQLIIGNKARAELRAFLNRYDVFEGRVERDETPIDRSAYTIATYSNAIYDALFDKEAGWEQLDPLAQVIVDNDQARDDLKAYVGETLVTEDDPQIAGHIQDERLLLAPTCILGILGKLLSEHYIALGGYPRSMLTAKAERWQHIYLIDRQFDALFGFREMFVNFRDEVYAKSTEVHTVEMADFVGSRHTDSTDGADMAMAAAIMHTMVVGELSLESEEGLCVVVPRKVEKSLADRLYQILSENNEQPMALTLLTDIINAGDGRKYVKATVSLALNKDSRFVNNGKKGLYALTEWHLPFFGSNADIIYQVLCQSDSPMESDEILDVLNQYPYNETLGKNELSSVISMTKDKFRKFGIGYYGLVDKEYDADLIKPGRNNFEADMKAFRDFVDTYQRLPSTKNGTEEKRLVYWFSRKRKEYGENAKWTLSKRDAFKEIIDLYEKYQALPNPEQEPEGEKGPEIRQEPEKGQELELEPEPAKEQKEAITSIEESLPPTPETPETPESPENPENPEIPETLDSPESPETPEIPSPPEEALEAIAQEMVGEPPFGLFAIDEESPFIAPDTTDEPPMELFVMEESLVSDESSASVEPLTAEESLASDESSTLEEPITSEEQPKPEEGGTIVFKDTDVPEDLIVSSEELSSSHQSELSDWFENGEAVRQFVEEHHREPLELFTKEHQLALWLQQQKENWHKGLLSPDKEQCLLAIRDMLW